MHPGTLSPSELSSVSLCFAFEFVLSLSLFIFSPLCPFGFHLFNWPLFLPQTTLLDSSLFIHTLPFSLVCLFSIKSLLLWTKNGQGLGTSYISFKLCIIFWFRLELLRLHNRQGVCSFPWFLLFTWVIFLMEFNSLHAISSASLFVYVVIEIKVKLYQTKNSADTMSVHATSILVLFTS